VSLRGSDRDIAMSYFVDRPWPVLVVLIITLWLSAWIGARALRSRPTEAGASVYYDIILGATLTLLSLIIGFTFSMAINHFDQRKGYESAEANAIRTAYLRADLLAPADAENFRMLLGKYLEQRILFYEATNEEELPPIDARTAQLQAHLWSTVRASGTSIPLIVTAVNDVLNARSSADASWTNRISLEAWTLMAAIAICGNVLVGYGARNFSARTIPILILPPVFLISISLYLIDDIDSPRSGLIAVGPENLVLLADSLSDTAHPLVSNVRLLSNQPAGAVTAH
jgi:hypothetical protein